MAQGYKILVVDSDESSRQMITYHLRQEGYPTDNCDSAEEALTLDMSVYNLILVDTSLKRIDGLRLTSLIKNAAPTAHLPLILCSAKSDPDSVIAGFNAGADDYIAKPISPRTLIARVKAMLRRTQ